MKRSLKWLVLLTVFVLLFIAGCARQQQPAPDQGEDQEGQQQGQPQEQPGQPAGQQLRIGMVTDVGGLGDQSFNDAAYRGLKRAEEELGAKIQVVESNELTAYVPNLTSLAEQGYGLVWAIGVLMQDALTEVAQSQPDDKFGIVDAVVDSQNVFSATFKEEEGSFLAGVVAGMMTKTNKIGFVGGMDIPPIRKFEAGFRAGIKAVNPNAKLVLGYTGVFDDPNKGKETALAQFGQNVDIIYHASGACGVGVIKAAEERNKYAIGVDSPQSHLAPNNVLTSMLKRVELAVFEGTESLKNGAFKGGQHKVYGLVENGVGLEEDQLKKMAPQEVLDKVEEFRQRIVNGEIKVPTTREESEAFAL